MVAFDASSSSDPDGDALVYSWTFDDGASASGAVHQHEYADEGDYIVTVIVADPSGAADTATMPVQIANAPPVITGLTVPLEAAAGAPATVAATYSDPGPADSLTLMIVWGDGTMDTAKTAGGVTHFYATAGSYLVRAIVRDNDGAQTTRDAANRIHVLANHPPRADAGGPYTGVEGTLIDFSARGSSDPDGDALTYVWYYLGSSVGGSGPGSTFFKGIYDITLIVTDSHGAADTATTTLTVTNAAPTIQYIYSPTTLELGKSARVIVSFNDLSPSDTHIVTLEWGDGTPENHPSNEPLLHTYTALGTYLVAATVRDNDGGRSARFVARYPLTVIDPDARSRIAEYEAVDLHTLGGSSTWPRDFNDHGQIVGSSLTASGTTHAFLWENGAIHDLGTAGNEESEAQRINNAGMIAGSVWTGQMDGRNLMPIIWRNGTGTVLERPVYQPMVAVATNESDDIVWTAYGQESHYAWFLSSGHWQQLDGLLGTPSAAQAVAMNERGQIVGSVGAVFTGESPNPYQHPVLWQDGSTQDLGPLEFIPCPLYPDRNCGYAVASSINELGQVAGFSTAAVGAHAVLWQDGKILDLWKAPGPGYWSGIVINDAGQVAGSADGEGFFWSKGQLQPLGSLGGGSTIVVDMNEAGTVAGTSRAANGEQHAFIWTRERGMVDLGTGPHHLTGAWVVGISYSGDVAGYSAPCDTFATSCSPPGEVRSILWRRIAP